jgi:DNA-binding MarR family transcriptional regulator
MASRTVSGGDVVISAHDAREIARLLQLLQPEHRQPVHWRPDAKPSVPPNLPRAKLLARAQALYAERNRRTHFFNRSIFGEPAWEMLLSLYIMDGHRLTAGKLASMIDAPQTTALRWVQYLEKEGLVARGADPDDRRFTCIELLDHGRNLLDRYFSSLPEGFGGSD